MREKEYRFDTDTMRYVEISEPARLRHFRHVRNLLVGCLIICAVNLCCSFSLHTSKLSRLERGNMSLIGEFRRTDRRTERIAKAAMELKQRDNYVYRSLFVSDTLDIPEIYIPYPDETYDFIGDGAYREIMERSWRSADQAARLLYLQSLSLDGISALSRDKDEMAMSIPAIWPINKKFLKSRIGAFGMRYHPIYHRSVFHQGIDMPGEKGTPIYATGNGTVKMTEIGRRRSGYGQQILIDHSYGYQTRYAHLNKILVSEGDRVVRGQMIGEMGNTGGSTGSHLHYEVIYMDRNVNPINYFRQDMSEDELEKIIESAEATTYETDEGPGIMSGGGEDASQ